MSRRLQILQAMGKGGGTPAPSPRRKQIREGLSKGPAGARTLPAGLPPIRYPDPMGNGKPMARTSVQAPGSPGVGKAVQPRLGAQLSNRVQSGAITEGQAKRTAQQRQTLRAAFGSDWRDKVFGEGGAQAAQEAGAFGRPALQARRNKMLERARRIRANGGTAA